MKTLIISTMLFAVVAGGESLRSGGRSEDWTKNKKGVQDHLVETLNPQTTNTYYTTNGTPYEVTNYTHPAENTNNALFQMRFDLLDENGNDCWAFYYDTLKCGGFDVYSQWALYTTFCENNKKLTAEKGLSEQAFFDLHKYTINTNGAWKVLNIPYVSDIEKVNERKAEFQKEKKKDK